MLHFNQFTSRDSRAENNNQFFLISSKYLQFKVFVCATLRYVELVMIMVMKNKNTFKTFLVETFFTEEIKHLFLIKKKEEL